MRDKGKPAEKFLYDTFSKKALTGNTGFLIKDTEAP